MIALNVMVCAVFYGINIQPPAPVEAKTIAIHSPIKQKVIPAVAGQPVRLVVPGVQLDLQVALGSYNPQVGDWTDSITKAHYADTSVPANDSNGTTLIYAHARSELFSRLTSLEQGDEAIVYTKNKHVLRYKFQSLKEVAPSDMSVFTEKGPPTLVLQTCSGPWNTYRALYSFDLIQEAVI